MYEDAIYWHLINKGYTSCKAKVEVERVIGEQKIKNNSLHKKNICIASIDAM